MERSKIGIGIDQDWEEYVLEEEAKERNLAKLIEDIKNAGPLIEAATDRHLRRNTQSGVQLMALHHAAVMTCARIVGPDYDAWFNNNADVRKLVDA